MKFVFFCSVFNANSLCVQSIALITRASINTQYILYAIIIVWKLCLVSEYCANALRLFYLYSKVNNVIEYETIAFQMLMYLFNITQILLLINNIDKYTLYYVYCMQN